MKKRIFALLTAICCLALTSCGNNETDSETARAVEPKSRMTEYYAMLAVPDNDSSESSDLSNDSGDTSQQDGQGSGGQQSGTSGGNTGSTTSSSEPEPPQTVRVTIPEGYTVAQVFTKLEQNGVCTAAELFAAMNSMDYSNYSFITNMGTTGDGNRCFKLEGYLYPNTYDFYLDAEPEQVIRVFLNEAKRHITRGYGSYSIDQTLTVASIIEREVNKSADMPLVASVIYNRLNSGMKLQVDATIVYVENYIKPFISGDINRYNASYNTNKCAALPAGAICNPGGNALNAALNPANTNYLYFVTGKDGTTYFAATYEEHQANCEKAGIAPDTTL